MFKELLNIKKEYIKMIRHTNIGLIIPDFVLTRFLFKKFKKIYEKNKIKNNRVLINLVLIVK